MPQMVFKKSYIIDTSSLIKLKPYPRMVKTFEPIWSTLEKMIDNEKLIAPLSVYKEILRGDDEIAEWCKQNKKMFIDEIKFIRHIDKVKAEYDGGYWKIQSEKPGPWADPWLLALSLSKPYLDAETGKTEFPPIINEEKNDGHTKIPYVAQKLGIPTLNLFQFFVEIGL